MDHDAGESPSGKRHASLDHNAGESPSGKGHEGGSKRPWVDAVDAIAKLLGALAILAVALVGNALQKRLTGISLQTQREQSDTQLRANMFNSLISPIVGSAKDGKPPSVDREQLLVELLALNFGEEFNMKPIMQDVDKKLRCENTPGPCEERRWELWAAARRVADGQIASLNWKWASEIGEHGCEVYFVTLEPNATKATTEEDKKDENCNLSRKYGDLISLNSPDNHYNVGIVPHQPDLKNQTIEMSVTAKPLLSETDVEYKHAPSLTYAFVLDPFEVPFTDNTVLSDGNRFAITLAQIDPPTETFFLKVIWFPKGYYTKQESPLDTREIRDLLGHKPQ